MFSRIKSRFLWTITSLLTIGGCGVSPTSQEDGSKLQGIYDQEYVLNFFQKENSDIYMLRSCLSTEGVGNFKEGSCVPALRTHEGKPVTFTLQELGDLSFGQEEKDRLNKALERWRPYQQALQNRQAGRVAAVSVAVGGAAITKHLVHKRSVVADALAASQAQLVKAQDLLKEGELDTLIKSQVKADSAKDLVQVTSKQLRNTTKKVGIAVAVTATTVTALIALSHQAIRDVKGTVKAFKEENEYLLEVLGAASPLFTPYSNQFNNIYIMATELPVKDILKKIALLPSLTTEAQDVNSKIQLYCLPTALENGEIGGECREP